MANSRNSHSPTSILSRSRKAKLVPLNQQLCPAKHRSAVQGSCCLTSDKLGGWFKCWKKQKSFPQLCHFFDFDFLIVSQWAELLVGRSFPLPRRRGMAARHGCQQVLWATHSYRSIELGPLCLWSLLHRLRPWLCGWGKLLLLSYGFSWVFSTSWLTAKDHEA